jgi:cytidyltransferase-like protein
MVVTFDELADIRARHAGQTIVLASGVFDLLHVGHVAYLQSMKQHGDVAVAMVKSDQRIRTHKHPDRPIIPEADRVRMVDAVKGVDYAFIGPYDHIGAGVEDTDGTYEQVFAALQPDVFYSTNEDWKKLEALGVKLVLAPRLAVGSLNSTTDIIHRVKMARI